MKLMLLIVSWWARIKKQDLSYLVSNLRMEYLVMAWQGTIVGELLSLSQIDYLFNVDNIIYQ